MAVPPRATSGPLDRSDNGPMNQTAELSHFLRSRRARITPDPVDPPAACASRRMPGLRRDEVARLAGMSPEYYARLEQGRARNPSSEILEALGRALSLDAAEREYLNDLCARAGKVPARPEPPQRVRPGLLHTLETLDHVPAFILGRRADVLAANSLACAVLTDFNRLQLGLDLGVPRLPLRCSQVKAAPGSVELSVRERAPFAGRRGRRLSYQAGS
jgi:transcriptional regulator with XRE-family HTH domain